MTLPIPWAEYDALPGLSQSALKPILVSGLEFQRFLKVKRKETPALRFGRALDCAAFTPQDYAIEFVVLKGAKDPSLNLSKPEGKQRRAQWSEQHPEDDALSPDEWRAKVQAAEHPGKSILTRDEHDRAWHCGEILRGHPLTRDYFRGGRMQVVLDWIDEKTGLRLKGRIDLLPDCRPCIVDLKSTKSVDAGSFGRDIARFGYHFQAATYRTGWHEMTGEWRDFKDVAIESLDPFDVGVFNIDGDALQKGNEMYRKALDRYAAYSASGIWPGRHQSEESASLPIHALVYDAPDEADDRPVAW